MIVSVIIPTHNYSNSITTTIASIIEQVDALQLNEIIVIDDGSTDQTADTVKAMQPSYPDLQYHFQPQAGKAAATRKGISLAKGEIIFTLDADDWLLPGKVLKSLSIFSNQSNVAHVASPALIHWEDGSRPDKPEPIPQPWLGRPMNGSILLREMYVTNKIYGGGSTFSAKASVLKNIPLPNEVDMYTDEWLLIHTLLQGNSYFFPEPLSVWRVHGGNYSGGGGEIKEEKVERLRRSSAFILQWLENGDYPSWLVKAYRLKHAVRCLVWDEQLGQKTAKDRWQFLRSLVLSGDYSPAMLHRYGAFGRLLK